MTDTQEPAAPLNLRQQAKARTYQKVLDASAALFAEVGYHQTGIRDIAKRAGMSTGAVFANFADKEAIYRTIHGHDPISPEQGLALLERLHDVLDNHTREDLAAMDSYEAAEVFLRETGLPLNDGSKVRP